MYIYSLYHYSMFRPQIAKAFSKLLPEAEPKGQRIRTSPLRSELQHQQAEQKLLLCRSRQKQAKTEKSMFLLESKKIE